MSDCVEEEAVAVAPTPAWTQLRFHQTQHDLWCTKKRFAAVVAGRGSGKTEIAKRRLVRFLPVKKDWPDPRYFYGAPTEQQAKRIAWNHLLRLIPKDWVDDINKSEMSVRTLFGSMLQVCGLDKPQRLEGVQWDGGVIDESSDIKPGTFDLSILPALTWRSGWCWRIGVPKRFGIGAIEFRKFFESAQNGEIEEAGAYSWESSEIIPPEALEYARAHMDARDYEEQFRAKWVTASGGIFYAFDEAYNVRPVLYNPALPILVGSDFNVDPMAWVLCHRYGDRLEVFDVLWLRNTNTHEALRTLATRYGSHRGGFEFYGDATGRGRRTSAASSDYIMICENADFKRMGRTVHYLYSNPPVADRFAATNAMICSASGTRRLFINKDNKDCKRLIDDLRLRTYKPGTREPDDEGDIGHITDALGYIIYKLFPIVVNVEGKYEVNVTRGS